MTLEPVETGLRRTCVDLTSRPTLSDIDLGCRRTPPIKGNGAYRMNRLILHPFAWLLPALLMFARRSKLACMHSNGLGA